MQTQRIRTDKCVILDLDETCVRTYSNFPKLQDLRIFSDAHLVDVRRRTYRITLEDAIGPKGGGDISDIWGVFRPGLREFLSFCSEYFSSVGVWSAGRKRYVEAVVDVIFRDTQEPEFVYTWDDTDKSNGVITKPLDRVFERYPNFRRENTFVIDDNLSTFSRNIGNGILIPSYSPPPTIEGIRRNDRRFSELQEWLSHESVATCTNVLELDKSAIFS